MITGLSECVFTLMDRSKGWDKIWSASVCSSDIELE